MAQKSISVKLFHVRYKLDGDSYPHEFLTTSADQPLWIQHQRREVLIWQVEPVTRVLTVGDIVQTHYCGKWRIGRVVDVARTRAQVRFANRKGMNWDDPECRVRWVSAHHLGTYKADMGGHDI